MTACLDDERLFALASGTLDAEARAHVDGCAECRALLAHTVRSLHPAPSPTTIGRYEVAGVIGAGAMGVVYRARDPVLVREVALKVLRGDEQLLREAEALARLSHPNVVAVHDAGRVGEHVFIAMELIEGETLASWLSERPRAPHEIVARFGAAGAGLAAAHDAGLVHRDFKPHNVLCGRDGRVRVADFGLAHPTGSAERGAPPVGTPAYMAPEQLAGEVVDARSDQFGFCVALHEALYGARPFTGDTMPQLQAAMRTAVRPPRRAGVPIAVRDALERGLRSAPAERFASMHALLAALRPRRRSRSWLALPLIAVALVAGWRVQLGQRRARCQASAAEIDPAWSAERRAAVEQAYAATGLRYAPQLAARTLSALDTYAEEWRRSRVQSCTATDRSPEAIERGVTCLADRRDELAAVTTLLTRADAAAVDEGLSLVEHLAPIAECAGGLAARRPTPIEPRLRAEAEQLGRTIAASAIEARLGHTSAARAQLDAAWPQLRKLAHLPLEAQAHLVDGRLRLDAGDAKGAIAELEEAASAGDAGRDDESVARARIALIEAIGIGAQDPQRGRAAARYAQAALARLGADRLEGDRQLALARVERSAGDADAALAAFDAAIARYAAAYGAESAPVGEALSARAGLYEAQGRHDDAVNDAEHAVAIAERTLGNLHPGMLRPLTQLGILHASEGKLPAAERDYRRALDIAAHTVGPDEARTATIRAELGQTLARLDRPEQAEAELQRALAISERTAGPAHADTAAIRDHLGVVYLERGDATRAREEHRRALLTLETTVGTIHPRTGRVLHHLAADELALGRAREALGAAEGAERVLTAAYGKDARDLAVCLTLSGEAHLQLGEASAALPLLERAMTMREARHASPRSLGETRLLLARALIATHGDRTRAKSLRDQATIDLASVKGASGDKLRAELARLKL